MGLEAQEATIMTVIVGYVLMRNHVCNAQIATVSAQIARDWIAIVEDWIAQLCDHKRLFLLRQSTYSSSHSRISVL